MNSPSECETSLVRAFRTDGSLSDDANNANVIPVSLLDGRRSGRPLGAVTQCDVLSHGPMGGSVGHGPSVVATCGR